MRRSLLALALLSCAFAMTTVHAEDTAKPKTALVIHGGAGVIERGSMTPEEEARARRLEAALDAGNAVLSKGGSALDAVDAAIVRARGIAALQRRQGRGVQRRRHARTRRLDHGRPYAARRCRCRRDHVRNPILLARAVMEHIAARDAGRRRRGEVRRHAAGHRARAQLLVRHRQPPQATRRRAGEREARKRGLDRRRARTSAPSARSRSTRRATSPRRPAPAA